MAEFTIATKDGEEFIIDAKDEAQAIEAFKRFQATSYTGPEQQTTVNGITTTTPEGMTFDPNTGAMVDTKALSEMKLKGAEATNLAMQPAKGLPFVGSWIDEAMGWLGSSDKPYDSAEVNTEMYRQLDKRTAEQYPKTTTGLQIAGGLSSIPAFVAAAPAAIPASAGLPMQMGLGGLYGAATGALEGFVSGAGANNQDRTAGAIEGSKWGAGLGAGLGVMAPGVAALAKAGIKNVADRFNVNQNLKQLGLSRVAADAIKRALAADDVLGPEGMKRIQRAGPDAMLADAGPAAGDLLDATIAKSGLGANTAEKAVENRAGASSNRFKMVLDKVLGVPEGVRKAGRDIANKTKNVRSSAYDAAYDTPIDYASDAGRTIEDIFSRVDDDTMRAAVKEANAAMRAKGIKNMQIMADIADDGTYTLRQMPNMRQVDELKKALDAVGNQTDQFGRPLPSSLRATMFARELRDAAISATGGEKGTYASALKLGGHKIAEDNALKLGYDLLSPNLTREIVKEGTKGISDAERTQLALGLRQRIDDTMANVQQAMSDPNIEAREAVRAVKDLTTRASREKVIMALGEDKARAVYRELEQVQAALELKARVATNSKTARRTAIQQDVKSQLEGGVLDAAKEGRPLETPRRLWQQATGATPDAKSAKEEEVFNQIAQLLTGPRGQNAIQSLQTLLDAYKAQGRNAALARGAGNLLTGGLLFPVYDQTKRQTTPATR